ncbi:MAG: hypothetical protein BM557_09660 [Flavobacterium sp. MedPE-SWcel]|uniref:hypothetical protein n=1 Tax=uncultured Flavobacterium sp. TaxID=165435 RepID=UPI00091A87E3|nr:hypothetical protein [uncultured Flavobacterium sp.]OIQ16570.1 MAG: hypothetical protein BM557_09660 [Flavobacterium sp. MedPE-SWcel]
MKKIFLLFLFAHTLILQSQELKTETDKTNEIIITTELLVDGKLDLDKSVGKDRVLFVLPVFQKPVDLEGFYSVDIVFDTKQLKVCLDQLSGKTIFYFDDDSTLECAQLVPKVCKSTLLGCRFLAGKSMDSFGYDYTKNEFMKLCNKTISKIRVVTTEGNIDIEIKDDYKQFLQNSFIKVSKKANEFMQ